MKSKLSPASWGRLAALLIAIDTVSAQSVSTNDHLQIDTVPSSEDKSSEKIVLSPFVVNSTQDTGYQASSTLAGTRLNTPVKDLAASISIYTKDFLNDIGAVDATDLLVFATGMDAAGNGGGNYSAGSNDINNIRSTGGDSIREDPQSGSRTRGLGAPTFTRDYFPTSIGFDSYNTSTVTVNRGPNAALFGVGSPAGVVDTALLQADPERNLNKLVVRYGNNNALRTSLDSNIMLIKHKLAARIALLDDDEQYNQRPAFQHLERAYGNLKFEPFKSSTFTATFESGHTTANRPMSVLPLNGVADFWYAAGRPSYDWTQYDDPAKNPAAATTAAGATTEGFLFNSRLTPYIAVIFPNPNAGPTSGFFGSLPTTTTFTANAVQSTLFNPVVNRDSANDTIRFLMTPQLLDVAAGYWTAATTPAGQQPGYTPAGLKSQTFTNSSAFDWANEELDTTGRQLNSFHTYNLNYQQSFWDNHIGTEVAYDRQRYDTHARDSLFANGNNDLVYVDVNVYLPTGQLNPNLGRPMALGAYHRMSDSSEDRENKRATAFLRYDFADLSDTWGKWFGRHTLTGLYENSRTDELSITYREAMTGDAASTVAGNINVANRFYSPVIYLGPSIIGNNNPLKLQQITVNAFGEGPTTPITYFSRQANQTDPGSFVTAPANVIDVLQSGAASREVIKSKAAVMQSNWLQDLLVSTLSWRRDEDYFYQQTIGYVQNPANALDPGKVHYGFNDISLPSIPAPFAAAEIKSYGLVLRWPQKLFKLPANSDFSIYFNNSGNFTPTGGRVDAYNNNLPSPKGKTKEWGFNLSFLNDKFSIRLSRFETAIKDATFTPNFFGTATVNSVNQTWVSWMQEGNINPAMAAQQTANANLLLSVLPASWKNLYQLTVSGTAPNIVASNLNGSLQGSADTTAYVATGTEADFVYNPTRSWRILANFASQATIQSNSYPVLTEFFKRMQPVWTQLANVPKGNYPTGYVPGTPLPASVQTYGQWLDANVYVPWATALATEGSASAEQPRFRINLVTNYTFLSGSVFGVKLKGFGVGTGVRWQDRYALGYPSTRNTDGSVNVDIKHPFWASPRINGNFWLSYQHLLPHNINWKVQLNANNVIGARHLLAANVQSYNGLVSTAYLPPDRRLYLTNSFDY